MNDTIQKPTDEALLPCPFCGGDGCIGKSNFPVFYFINCNDCTASSDVLLAAENEYTLDQAIARWNTRAADPLRAIIPPAIESALIAREACVVPMVYHGADLRGAIYGKSAATANIALEDVRLDKPKPETGDE